MTTPKQTYITYKKPNWLTRNLTELLTIIGGLLAINLIFFAKAYTETNTVDPATSEDRANMKLTPRNEQWTFQ